MTPHIGRHLKIRSTIYIAGEPIPFFWPMRAFIHHNPLHGLEHLPFADAVARGAKLFHGRGFLPRRLYQEALASGQIEAADLARELARLAERITALPGIDFKRWGRSLLQDFSAPMMPRQLVALPRQIYTALHKMPPEDVPQTEGTAPAGEMDFILPHLRRHLLEERPVYAAVDALFGSDLGERLDEQVIRACLDFFDEGQAAWVMPNRERGFFAAWRAVAGGRVRRLLRKIANAQQISVHALPPEAVIDHVMSAMHIPEAHWRSYFTHELARLHGWAGFIRWRAQAKHYYWSEHFPGDLVDLLAVRLTLAWLHLNGRGQRKRPKTYQDLAQYIEQQPDEAYLRLALHDGQLLPRMVGPVTQAIARGKSARLATLCRRHVQETRSLQARQIARTLDILAEHTGQRTALDSLSSEQLFALVTALGRLEADEGMLWLRAMEGRAIRQLTESVTLTPPPPREKRPFVQAAFCIDTRSERIRRHLEQVGDYQTFGIAGFFGVPVSLIELGKGSEAHLCPVLLTPKNLVLEMTAAEDVADAAFTTLGHAAHELKETVFAPFVTVEAIGLLFGFDMIGKTLAPRAYNTWRKRLHNGKPRTHLLLDKLSREQADSVVRAVQRAVIVEALQHELGLGSEAITDDIVRALREMALATGDAGPAAEAAEDAVELAARLNIKPQRLAGLIATLRDTYRINPAFARLQLEQLGRIGFSLDEQVTFVHQALSSIGLTENFSRFILLVGHGSTSENNPYESALDCGACGGAHGLISARVLAQMANRPAVRRRLAQRGIEIPDDAHFVPALHNTTTDEIRLHDLELLPTTHLIYLERLRTGLISAARLCAQERLPSLGTVNGRIDAAKAFEKTQRNALDWSQVRPEWGLARNAYFIIGRRQLTQHLKLDGRAFLHSYDYRIDRKFHLLENILTGPLVVGQWINMEHYFSAVDNERFGSGSKVYHNVAGRFAVMTGNLSDLRTGLPAQTVLQKGRPYHQPIRLITVIEAPFKATLAAIERVASVKQLVANGWIRLVVIDPETTRTHIHDETGWVVGEPPTSAREELSTS